MKDIMHSLRNACGHLTSEALHIQVVEEELQNWK